MATTAMSAYSPREQLARTQNTLRSTREKAKEVVKTTNGAVITIGGGALAGVVEAKMPYLMGTTLPSAAVLGATALAAGLMGWFQEESHFAVNVGSGMLASAAGAWAKAAMQQQASSGG